MAQWTSIEDETGMTYVNTSPHFAFENGYAAIRTDDVDLTAAVIDGRLLKVILKDAAAVEAVGFVAMREKASLSLLDDAGLAADLLVDGVSATDYLGGSMALGAMTETDFTYSSTWTFASHVFTRTADPGNLDIVFDTNAVAGTLYKVVLTHTRTAGTLTPQIGGTDGTGLTTSGTNTLYIRAGDTTAFTLQADATFAGTVTACYVYAIDETGYAVEGTNTLSVADNTAILLCTYVDDANFVKITLDDVFTGLTSGTLYRLGVKLGMGTGDTISVALYNSSDEAGPAQDVADTSAMMYFYFHYEAGMYMLFTGGDASDVLDIDTSTWVCQEVKGPLGTDALVIMNSDGMKYRWESIGAGFEKNDDDYTFDIYEMQGGGENFTRLATNPSTMGDQGFISPSTSRDSAMEYPDHKDMEDFD